MASSTRPDISFEGLVARNKEYAATTHKKLPPILTLLGGDPKARPGTLVVSCIDSRSDPYLIFDLPPFSILSLRTVAGRITPILSDIAALDSFFHVSQVIILHHSNCGASHVTHSASLAKIHNDRPEVTSEALEELRGKLPFKTDDEQSVKDDLKKVKECEFLRKEIVDGVKGLWLDVGTGEVTLVE